MCARMNDAIHVQVQIVELNPIWVWFGNINWQSFSIWTMSDLYKFNNLNG